MRLLRCHIDNFGKFTDYTVDFTENPQVFYEPNGWGKSTLAAFIKVMFYGFAGESKRGATLEKERVRYRPWKGGVYGGEIWFEAGEKQYLMNRTFGSKEAEDTFALYDGVTNLPSEDYSTNIGEELFQINQESFLRTVFLAQNACDTATTDSINAKIGNLADNLDDINKYEEVQKRLKDLQNGMSPTRKTGSLKQKKEVIAQLKDELRKAGAIEGAVAELEAKEALCVEDRERLAAERRATQVEWEMLTCRKAVEAKKTHYESIVNQCGEKQRLVNEKLEAMGGQVPQREELALVQQQYKLLQERESEALANALQESEKEELSRLRKRFAAGLPKAEVLKDAREQISQLEKLRLEAAGRTLDEGEVLEKKRLEMQLTCPVEDREEGDRWLTNLEGRLEESLQQIHSYMERQNGLGVKKATLSSLRAMERQKVQLMAVALWIVGLILAVAGGVLLAFANKTVAVVLLCAAAAAVVMGVAVYASGRRGQIRPRQEAEAVQREISLPYESVSALEQEIAEDEEQMGHSRNFVETVLRQIGETQEPTWEDPIRLRDKLYGFKEDVKRLQRLRAKAADYQARGYEAAIQQMEERVEAVLKPYCGQVEAHHMNELVTAISQDRERFVALCAREEKYRVAQSEGARYRQQVEAYLARYHQGVLNLYDSLQKLTGILCDYENDCRELDRLKTEKADFEATNDIETFGQDATGTAGSEEELKERIDGLDDAIASLNEQLHAYRRQLEDRQEELEELAVWRERLALAEAEYEQEYVYYTRIGYVSAYLEKAKESLSARYIGPVLDSFKRNYELLSGESGEDFRMDANIHLTRRAMGEQRETQAFSAGNRDLINIVLRVALIDAMYQKEPPFLIIDDSFVNLDGNRLKTAGQFMKQIAKEYQVIYFTCHESRVFDGLVSGV